MSRLTKEKEKYFGNLTQDMKIYNKLFDIEDLEEELGIDLITLFKALKDGIYVKNLITKETMYIDNNDVILKYDDLYSPTLVSFHKDYYPNEELYFCVNAFNEKLCYMIKGYKKTWWLKEDLENGN